jgi:hypothetical protein
MEQPQVTDGVDLQIQRVVANKGITSSGKRVEFLSKEL